MFPPAGVIGYTLSIIQSYFQNGTDALQVGKNNQSIKQTNKKPKPEPKPKRSTTLEKQPFLFLCIRDQAKQNIL